MRNFIWTGRRTNPGDGGFTSLQVGVAVSVGLLLFFAVAFLLSREESNRLRTRLERTADKTQLVQAMKSELLASAVAEKSAVMADTDEDSKAFAEQSMQASRKVEKARMEFGALIEKDSKEAKLFNDFSSCWGKLQEIDKEVLTLSVQNTNIKAFRLSFNPAAVAIRNMEEALSRLMDAAAPYPNAAEITRWASKALTGALDIYTLQAPHIAETTDAGMDRIEANMKRLDEQVHDALSRLDSLVGDSDKPLVEEARKSYQDFQNVNAEIIDLSRRNSNIRSFALSLDQKRNSMAQCMDLLDALQDAVQEGVVPMATR